MRIEDWMMDRFRRELDDTFRAFFSESRLGSTPLNVWADDERVVVTAEIPGVKPEDIDLSVMGETLVLKSRRATADAAARSEGAPSATWLRRERTEGEATRTLTLPYRVDAGAVEATAENGILTLRFPRAAEDKPRRIAVKAA